MSTKKRIFINTIRALGSEAFSKLLTFFINILIARKLGSVGFGILNTASSISLLVSMIADAGIARLALRNLAVSPKEFYTYMINGTVIRIGITLMFLGLIIPFRNNERIPYSIVLLMTIYGMLNGINELFKIPRRAGGKIRMESIVKSRQSIMHCLVFIPLLVGRITISLYTVITTYIIGSILQLGLLYTYRLCTIEQTGGKKRGKLTQTLQQGFPFVRSSILTYLYGESTIILISRILGQEQVGQYAAAYRMTLYVYMIMDIMTQVWFKQLSDEHHASDSKRGFLWLLLTQSSIGILWAICCYLTSGWLLTSIYSAEFAIANTLLPGFGLIAIITGINFTYSTMITIQHLERTRVYIQIAVAFLHISLTTRGIHRYGLMGALGAFALSQGVMMIGYISIVHLTDKTHSLAKSSTVQ